MSPYPNITFQIGRSYDEVRRERQSCTLIRSLQIEIGAFGRRINRIERLLQQNVLREPR